MAQQRTVTGAARRGHAARERLSRVQLVIGRKTTSTFTLASRILVAGFLVCFAPAAAVAGELNVEVLGISPNRGKVYVMLYDRQDRFPDSPRMDLVVTGADGNGRVHFKDLASGSYAAFAFQDLNGNGEMDCNVLGMPQEPYGFSNGARGSMGPPSFAQAAVNVGSVASTTITLKQ